jgi:hypothetical protein
MKMLPVPKTSGCRRWFTCGAVGAVAGGAFFAILAVIYFWSQPPVYTPPTYISDTPSIPLVDGTPSFTPSPTETGTATPTLTPSATNTPTPVILFDFINEASNAKWSFLVNDPDGAYEYPVPFAIQTPFISPEDQANFDIEPYAGWQKSPPMEDQSQERLVILAYPAAHQLSGLYDLQNYVIQAGDTLVVKVGFKQAGKFSTDADGVRFSIIFANESADVFDILFEMPDKMDGRTYTKEIDLSPYAGQSGNFILRVSSEQTYVNDFSVWADAYIQRP